MQQILQAARESEHRCLVAAPNPGLDQRGDLVCRLLQQYYCGTVPRSRTDLTNEDVNEPYAQQAGRSDPNPTAAAGPLPSATVADVAPLEATPPLNRELPASSDSNIPENTAHLGATRLLLCSHHDGVFGEALQASLNAVSGGPRRGVEVAEWRVSGGDDRKCLGGTFDLCVFFDVEGAKASDVWAAVETVRGGGVICLVVPLQLVEAVTSGQPQSFATQAQGEVLLRSLVAPQSPCVFVDSDCVPIKVCQSSEYRQKPAASERSNHEVQTAAEVPVWQQKNSPGSAEPVSDVGTRAKGESASDGLSTTEPSPPPTLPRAILNACCTEDQRSVVKALFASVVHGFDADIFDKQDVVSLTGNRGRGKSAVVGLLIAAILNTLLPDRHRSVLVTGPAPENVQGIFAFVQRGLELLGAAAHVTRTSNGAISQIQAVSGGARCDGPLPQVWYIAPSGAAGMIEALSASGSEPLLVVDETASMWLPHLHSLVGAPTRTVLLLGTTTGAEGTGAAVVEKLFKSLDASVGGATAIKAGLPPQCTRGRSFSRLALRQPVRYAMGDPVEAWLGRLLFLDAPPPPTDPAVYGTPASAKLFHVNARYIQDHPNDPTVRRIVGLLIGHYRTSPDDLLAMMSAEYALTFVLMANGGEGPPAVVVAGVVEDPCPRHTATSKSNLVGFAAEQQFPHVVLTKRAGFRPWRVIAAQGVRGKGFGRLALGLIEARLTPTVDPGALSESHQADTGEGRNMSVEHDRPPMRPDPRLTKSQPTTDATSLQAADSTPAPSTDTDDQLLVPAATARLPRFAWLGVSFGATRPLFRFWRKCGYAAVAMSPVLNNQTGEQSIVMLRPLTPDVATLLPSLVSEFTTGFFRQLGSCFRQVDPPLASDILLAALKDARETATLQQLAAQGTGVGSAPTSHRKAAAQRADGRHMRQGGATSSTVLDRVTWVPSPIEMARLRSLASAHKVGPAVEKCYDLLPSLAEAYFLGQLGGFRLQRPVSEHALCAVGAQRQTLADACGHAGVTVNELAGNLCRSAAHVAYFTGIALHGIECLLTVAPRSQIVLNRSQSHRLGQVWLPAVSAIALRGSGDPAVVRVTLPEPTSSAATAATADLTSFGKGARNAVAVQEPYFTELMTGKKTVEGRLARRRFASLIVGDAIEIRPSRQEPITAAGGEVGVFRVVRVTPYPSFAEMLQGEGLARVLPSVTSIDAGVAVYRAFYSAQDEAEVGVVAIEVARMDIAPDTAPLPIHGITPTLLGERAAIDGREQTASSVRDKQSGTASAHGDAQGNADPTFSLPLRCTWVVPPNTAGTMTNGELRVSPLWDEPRPTLTADWAVEVRTFRHITEGFAPLPSNPDGDLALLLDLGSRQKARWGDVRVLLAVWPDEVAAGITEDAGVGKAWLPDLSTLSTTPQTLTLHLEPTAGSVLRGTSASLTFDAVWEYPLASNSLTPHRDEVLLSGDAGGGAPPTARKGRQAKSPTKKGDRRKTASAAAAAHPAVFGRLTLRHARLVAERTTSVGATFLQARVLEETSQDVEAPDGVCRVTLSAPLPSTRKGRSQVPRRPARRKAHGIAVIVPEHLRKLGRRLRFCGIDTVIAKSMAEATERAVSERRLLVLSSDQRPGKFLTKGVLASACMVPPPSQSAPIDHLVAAVCGHAGHVLVMADVASRCVECNAGHFVLLHPEAIEEDDGIPREVLERRNELWRCARCRKVYWEGTSFARSLAQVPFAANGEQR